MKEHFEVLGRTSEGDSGQPKEVRWCVAVAGGLRGES
jgi:hypothetical protein